VTIENGSRRNKMTSTELIQPTGVGHGTVTLLLENRIRYELQLFPVNLSVFEGTG
jgi:hypothetical protein